MRGGFVLGKVEKTEGDGPGGLFFLAVISFSTFASANVKNEPSHFFADHSCRLFQIPLSPRHP